MHQLLNKCSVFHHSEHSFNFFSFFIQIFMDSSLIRVRPRRALLINKPLLLKDHLMDDMSSCSSNGFKSFPRRSQCCTAVRFLHDFDRKHKQQQKKSSTFNKKPSKPALSAFRSVVAALKRLTFAKTPEKIKPKCSSLGRSFSKSEFWTKKKKKKKKPEQKAIGRWRSFDQLMKDESEPSAGSESNSWSSTDFTDECSSGKCCSSEVNLNLLQEGSGNGAVSTDSTTSSDDSSANTTKQKQWQSDQDKEQLSPVSVLDCPFVDEDEVSSLFQHRLDRMEGTKMNLMKKIQRFECLAKVEPVNLATQFALQSDNSDNESSDGSPLLHYSSSVDEQSISTIEEEDDDKNEAEHKAFELLHQMKANYLQSYPDLKLKEDKLLQDFFIEKITYECANPEKQRGCESSFDEGLLEEAENWINGKRTREHCIEWEVQKNRQVYVEDMEKRGEWRTLGQEREEVGLELGNEVFVEVMNEVLLDISV